MSYLAPCALALAIAAGCGLAGCAPDAPQAMPETGGAIEQPAEAEGGETAEPEEEAAAQEEAPEPVHEHTWVSEYQLQTIPAVTETIHHEAEKEEVTENHTICNVCFEVVDGIIEQHQAETGHVGVSTNVPVPVEKVMVEAWDETVIKTPEETKLVSNSEKCSDCGEVRQLEQTKVIDPADAAQAASGAAQGAQAPAAN